MRGFAIIATLVATTLMATTAVAQVAPAPGFKVGDGRLHPFLDVDAHYDSVVGFFDKDTNGNVLPSGDLLFSFRPGLRFELLNDQTTVNFTGNAEYVFYSGLISPAARNLSRFQANVGLETAFNRDGAVEFDLGDTLSRSDRTQNAAIGIGVLSLYNDAHISAPIHPGGRALEFTPRVGFQVEFFDPLLTGLSSGCPTSTDITCNPALVNQMNYANLNYALQARYKFFPKTAIVFDANFDQRLYFSQNTQNRTANVLHITAGLAGLLTPRVSVTLMAGVAHDFGSSGATAPIGQLQISYVPTELITLSVGYVRNVLPVAVFGVFADDRGFLNGKLGFFGGRFHLDGQAAFDYFSFYGTNTSGTASVGRNDVAFSLTVGPHFDIVSWLQIGLNYLLSYRTSSASVAAINYVRHEVILGLDLHY